MKKLTALIAMSFMAVMIGWINTTVADEAKPEWLFVQTAEKAEATSETTLVMLSGRDIFAFTDRPYREHAYITTKKFATLWDEGGTFNEDPPNAVLTWVSGEYMKKSEIIIYGAEWHSDGRVTYSYTVVAGDAPEQSMSTMSLFIDGEVTHVRTARPGDTVQQLAREVYGSPQSYVNVARSNSLPSTRRLAVGTRLAFPPSK